MPLLARSRSYFFDFLDVFNRTPGANEVENLAQALRFIGYGLECNDRDSGSPISALASTAVQRLSALKEIWKKMIKASAGA